MLRQAYLFPLVRLFTVVAFLILCAASSALAQTNTTYGCYVASPPHTLRSPGDVRIVSSPADCTAGETWISWDVFPVGSHPVGINFDGTNIWVLNSNCWECPGTVTKLRANDGANLGTFPAGQTPERSLIVGEHIWITNRPANTLTKLRLSDGSLVATYNVRRGPAGLAFDGTNIWVSYYLDSSVSRVRPSDAVELSNTPGVSSALGIRFDGSNVWVANNLNDGKITKISGSTGAILGVFSTNGRFPGRGVGFDGTNIWLTNSGTQTIAKFNDNGTIASQFSSGFGADDFAFDGTNMWVPNEDVVLKYRASDGALLGSFPNSHLGGSAVFDGTYVWVTNQGANTVTRYRDGALVQPSSNGLVAWYKEDGNPNDSVGHHNPSATNATSFVTGKIGQGTSIARGGYIEIPDSVDLQNQQFTLSVWARPEGLGSNFDVPGAVLIQKGVSLNSNGSAPNGDFYTSLGVWWSPIDGGRFRTAIGDNRFNMIVSAHSFPIGEFHRVTSTYDGTKLRLYVDCKLEAEKTVSFTVQYDPAVPWTIGSTYRDIRNLGYARNFDGVIDEVKIWNKALTEEEVNGIDDALTCTSDNIAPTTNATQNPSANGAGWSNADVTLTLAANDDAGGTGVHDITYSASGAQVIPQTTVNGATANVSITAEGETTISYFARDAAGNTEAAQTLTVKIDKSAPSITSSATAGGNPYAAGTWTNQDVVVSFNCTDTGSGAADVTQPFTVTGEGADQSVSGNCTDVAGNTASSSFANIRIDKTAPVINASRTPSANASGWNNQNVTAGYTASDSLSGLDSNSLPNGSFVFTGEGANQSHTFTVSDIAGNTASATVENVNIDKSAPSVSCGSADGAWHASDVSIPCTAGDSTSGLTYSGDGSFNLTTSVPLNAETSNAATGNRTVCDVAGNCTTVGPIGGNKVDKKPPVITITVPAAGTYLLNQRVTATYSCSDGGSGVATCAGTAPSGSSIDTASVGAKTFTVTTADNTGNVAAPSSVNYAVTYGVLSLFDQTKAAKSGSTIPVKLQLVDATGANVSSPSLTVHALSVMQIGSSASPVLDDAGAANPDFDFRYDASLGGYIFNLKTTGYGTGTYLLNYTAGGDTVMHSVQFQVRQ